MDYEIFFLITAALLYLLDLILLSRSKDSNTQRLKVGFASTTFAFGLLLFFYFLLLQYFISNNFQLENVYSYSSSSAPLLSKIYASWAGAGGSMLLLTILLSLVYFSLRILALKKSNSFNIKVCQVFSIVLIVFVIVCMFRNPFERFEYVPAEGKGLNPQLQTLWMVIHPPIVFVAYVFIVLAYVLTLASIRTGRDIDKSGLFKISSYLGWLLLTLGIALGGVWAYEVLGWGGYWAWDPVETASLLPWLFLTAYFILKHISKNKSSLAREFMIMVTFASLVFLSALTRGGFTQSVHSYAVVSPVGPIMLTFALGMISYFFYLKKNRKIPLFKLNVDKSSLSSRSFSWGFWALILIAIVCLVGLAFKNFSYSYWTFPFVLIFIISLIGFSFEEKTHYARVLIIVLISMGLGAGASLFGFSGVNFLTVFTVPLLIIALLLLLFKVFKSIRRKSRFLGQSFLGVATIVLLLGVFISAGAKETVNISDAKADTSIDALQLRITISNFTSSRSLTNIYNEKVAAVISEYSTIQADVTVHQSERNYAGILLANFYPNYGLLLKPLIISTETGDFYIHFDYSDSLYNALAQSYTGNTTIPEELSITMQNIPRVYLVWTGVALMLAGISVQLVEELTYRKERTIS